MLRRTVLPLIVLAVVALTALGCGLDELPDGAANPMPTPLSATVTPSPEPTPPPTPTEHPLARVPYDPELHVLVDKDRALPDGYEPPELRAIPDEWFVPGYGSQYLRADVLDVVVEMLNDARAQGLDIRIRSAYRSYQTQAETFAHWVGVHGEEEARRRSAPPGHSEHQLGTTIDFSSPHVDWALTSAFDETPEGEWLAEHAHRYGLALSYPRDAEDITGYIYEPWHYRYIGEHAAEAWDAADRPPLISFLEELAAQQESP